LGLTGAKNCHGEHIPPVTLSSEYSFPPVPLNPPLANHFTCHNRHADEIHHPPFRSAASEGTMRIFFLAGLAGGL
ncbi:hypothetical protein, partial [Pseudomonas urethralis]|uniref:hypothetical protein n=1 Tax=Pseudomonas urethralis TaxID=2740517 RepID=UPI001CA5341B